MTKEDFITEILPILGTLGISKNYVEKNTVIQEMEYRGKPMLRYNLAFGNCDLFVDVGDAISATWYFYNGRYGTTGSSFKQVFIGYASIVSET
jgi:hypothetical protein